MIGWRRNCSIMRMGVRLGEDRLLLRILMRNRRAGRRREMRCRSSCSRGIRRFLILRIIRGLILMWRINRRSTLSVRENKRPPSTKPANSISISSKQKKARPTPQSSFSRNVKRQKTNWSCHLCARYNNRRWIWRISSSIFRKLGLWQHIWRWIRMRWNGFNWNIMGWELSRWMRLWMHWISKSTSKAWLSTKMN